MAKRFWIFTHNFTHSGAPLVMASIARELAAAGWREQLRVVSWGGLHDRRHSTLQHELALEGIHCRILDWHQKPPCVRRGDRLLLNSLALPEAVIRQALDWLQNKQISRIDWYCHEANPSEFVSSIDFSGRIRGLMEGRALTIKVPSERTLETYQNWLNFDKDQLGVQAPKLVINPRHLGALLSDYSEIKFQITGPVGCGKKGHLWFLRLLQEALKEIPMDTPGLRPVRLKFIGIEDGHYAGLARSVCRRAKDLLGDQFSWTSPLKRELALKAMAESNIAISCSMEETFSLVIAEAMALGQPILRNQTGGWDEQLVDYGNGFDLGEASPGFNAGHVKLIQALRFKNQVTDQLLKEMSRESTKISRKFMEVAYMSWLD